ncbi:unnamed protein product [Rhodiola kirilowii]
MKTENTASVPAQGSSSQSVFQEEGLRLICYPVLPVKKTIPVGESSSKSRDLGGFMDEKLFPIYQERYFQPQATDNRRDLCGDTVDQRNCAERLNWRGSGIGGKFGGGGFKEEEDLEDDEDVDDDIQEDEILVDGEGDCEISTNRLKTSGDPFNPDQINYRKLKQHANIGESSNVNPPQGKDNLFQNALPITAISGDGYYSRVVNISELSDPQRVDVVMPEKGSGSTLRKEVPLFESVRSILSDPITGELMDDAVIFPCGHSFGAGGLQHSLQKKACYTCSLPITGESVQKNLTLRAAVAAFRREKYNNRPFKRIRDWFEEKADFSDANHMGSPSRGIPFPFAVADRVMIVGNKRTPQRLVGCEAIITAQCLNGWYIVKTLDSAESVKLQHRSLTKIPEESPSKKKFALKATAT